jgi:RimJ/RimL family protein N-acetyltransferase
MFGRVELVTYSDGDLALTEALETDPDVMRELGGPTPKARLAEVHRRRLKTVAGGDWYFKIVPEPPGPAVGTIGIWPSTWTDAEIHETGWMVLPEFQGRGFASRALEILLSRARADPRFSRIHAFPGVTNAASNALCRKFGFSQLEESEVEFRDRTLRVNHWVVDV